jgi:hypothetical protein
VSYRPSANEMQARRWFSRESFTDPHTKEHFMFPVVRYLGIDRCLCRGCTPSSNAVDEESIQVTYSKLLEVHLRALSHVLALQSAP